MGLGIHELVGDKGAEIVRLAARHGVSNVRVFGSVARGEARLESDVDLLVDGLEHTAWGGGGLLVELEALLGRSVDLVTVDDLHWSMRNRVLKEAVPL
jgi:predicted nucleotidyltransferase